MPSEAEVYELLQLHSEVTISGTCVYHNHAGQLHRVHGPAIIWADGDLEWWQNDQRHREDGPAIEYNDGYKEWWLNGSAYLESDYYAQLAARSTACPQKQHYTTH